MWSNRGGGDRERIKERERNREGLERKQWMETNLSQVPSTCFEYMGGWGMPMRSSDTDADQGKGRSSKTPNLGTWVQSMRERALRCTSVCAREGPAWMQRFGLMAGQASFLLSPSLSSPSWVSQLSPCLSISCLRVSASPWQPVLGVCWHRRHLLGGGVPMAAADASHTLIHIGVPPPPPLNPQEDSPTADSHSVVNGSPHPISPTKCGLQTHKWPALTLRRENGWEPVSLKTPKTWPRKDRGASQARPG